jgi:hypothetical protein
MVIIALYFQRVNLSAEEGKPAHSILFMVKRGELSEELKGNRKCGVYRSMDLQDFSRLKRPRYEMHDFIREALDQHGLMETYKNRPAYQQNDYIAWIIRARRKETQEKRLAQMLVELEKGNKYMNMDYHPKKTDSPRLQS